jgi:hypothetical protein
MTSKIGEHIQATGHSKAWDIVNGQVTSVDGGPPNIEDILSQVRGLLKYVGEEGVGGVERSELSDLEDEICGEICKLVDVELLEEDTGYHDMATWLGAIERSHPVEVFTTNYDMLIEQALENEGISYFDGFVGAHRPFFDLYSVSNDDLPSRWLRLWKIHGSVNWKIEDDGDTTEIWRSDSVEGQQAVIHPSHKKYDKSRKMPYLALIDRLQAFLSKPDSVLFVIGYSFGDEHLNDVLLQGLQGSPSSAVFAFMYGCLDDNKRIKALSKKRHNLTVLARDAGVVGTRVQRWDTQESEPEDPHISEGVKWEKANGKWEEQMLLGDFREFGRFLKSVT